MIKRFLNILIFLLMLQSFSAYAQNIPDTVLHDDGAILYVGTLEEFESKDYPSMPNDKITSMVFKPERVYKGDAEPDRIISYKNSNIYESLSKGEKYLVADFINCVGENNSVYVYKIALLEDDKIALEQATAFVDAQILQEDINSGAVERAETERLTIGRRQSLDEYLHYDSKITEVIFTYKGDRYRADAYTFGEFAKNVYITNVPDSPLERIGDSDAYDEILYIELFGENSDLHSYMSVSESGEVSNNSPSMSILPSCEYQMDIIGLSMLYELMRDPSTEILTLTPAITQWYDDVNKLVFGMVLFLAISIISLSAYLYRRKTSEDKHR